MKIISYLCLFLLTISNSAWAADKTTPSNGLAGKQLNYYLRVFDYTMDNMEAGKSFHWDAGTASGNIRVSEEYISKSKATCRNFTETFIIDNIAGTSEGAACKRDGKGWCRLKNEDAHTCALEEPQGFTDRFLNGMDRTIGSSKEMMRNTRDWWNR
jgi:hypothetical protein